ncbi:hypothetical protein JOM56_012985 [Amanita muscaria]
MQAKFRVSTTPNACPVTPRNNLATPFSPFSSGYRAPAPLSPLVCPRTPTPSLSFHASPSLTQKRKRTDDKENELPEYSDYTASVTSTSKKPKYSARRNNQQKLEDVFKAIDDANWVLGEFLYHVFRLKDEDGSKRHRSRQHAKLASSFLQGMTRYTPAMIVDAWFRDPDGCIPSSCTDEHLMYSTKIPYTEIQSIRPALTSFAVQIVEKRLISEAQHAVEWADIGSATVPRVAELLQKHQPLTWHFLTSIALPEDWRKTKAQSKPECPQRTVHTRRPVETVCTHVLSSLNFTRNNEARLLPLARGLLYFAFSAPVDLISYGSRIGEMPAYSTIYNALKGLSTHAAAVTAAHGRDPTTCGFLQIDNTQHYKRQYDLRIGRTNQMVIGIAATYSELAGVEVSALDLEDKRCRIAKNQRLKVTVKTFLDLLDAKHIETVSMLHWLRVLVHYIPALSKWREHVSMLFRTRASKLPLPAQATIVHPLASSGKNETVTTELKDALVDFFAQMGQSPGDYHRRLILVGGDGLTYEKMLVQKQYLQFHNDPFQSFELLEPVLSLWHTEWTDLSRIYETHWDSLQSEDPSTLGHSAAQVNHPAPPNLKKVDYYPAAEFLYLVLDVRILDCWRLHFGCNNLFTYFEDLMASGHLPEIETLEEAARKLHRAYSSTRGVYQALHETTETSTWSRTVPLGTPWVPPPTFESSDSLSEPKKKPKRPTKKIADDLGRHPKGDRVLANSIMFMRDAMISREMSYAIAEGDAGRVHEVMKVMLFTFAGSSHSKYTTYLLETICNLEMESGPALRDTILKSTLVNLSGRPGAFSAADLMQEYFNRLLEAIVEKKGIEYGHTFIRQVVSRNLHHFARIKLDLHNGIGLTKHSGRHVAPHLKPEVETLLETYTQSELHCRRPGRAYSEEDRDDFDTTRNRGLKTDPPAPVDIEEEEGDPEEIEEPAEEGNNPNPPSPPTWGYVEVINGELIFGDRDVLAADVDQWFTRVEEENMEDENMAIDKLDD